MLFVYFLLLFLLLFSFFLYFLFFFFINFLKRYFCLWIIRNCKSKEFSFLWCCYCSFQFIWRIGAIIWQIYNKLVENGTVISKPELAVLTIPIDYSWTQFLGLIRKPISFISTIRYIIIYLFIFFFLYSYYFFFVIYSFFSFFFFSFSLFFV